MAKISIDMEEIKKEIKTRADKAKFQITEIANKAQKDLTKENVKAKLDQVIETIKSQDFMKNPKVAELMKNPRLSEIINNPKIVELTKKIKSFSERLEETLTRNANQWRDEVAARFSKKDHVETKAHSDEDTPTRAKSTKRTSKRRSEY